MNWYPYFFLGYCRWYSKNIDIAKDSLRELYWKIDDRNLARLNIERYSVNAFVSSFLLSDASCPFWSSCTWQRAIIWIPCTHCVSRKSRVEEENEKKKDNDDEREGHEKSLIVHYRSAWKTKVILCPIAIISVHHTIVWALFSFTKKIIIKWSFQILLHFPSA